MSLDRKDSLADIWPKCSGPLADGPEWMTGLVWSTCLSVILSHSKTRTQPDQLAKIIWPHVCATFGPDVYFFPTTRPNGCISKRTRGNFPPLSSSGSSYVARVWPKCGLLCHISAKGSCYQGYLCIFIQRVTKIIEVLHFKYRCVPLAALIPHWKNKGIYENKIFTLNIIKMTLQEKTLRCLNKKNQW